MRGNIGEIQLGSERELYKYINHYAVVTKASSKIVLVQVYSADRTSGVRGTGTSGFFNHLERYHPIEHALVKEASQSSPNAKQAKVQVLTGAAV